MNDGTLGWGWAGISFAGRVQTWQTLQDPTGPILPAYDRTPEINAAYSRPDLWGGMDANVQADYTDFRRSLNDLVRTSFASDPTINQPNAQRSYMVAELSRPWQAPGWFVIPKARVHSRYYAFDTPLATGEKDAAVTVPTFSLDSGVVLERKKYRLLAYAYWIFLAGLVAAAAAFVLDYF